MIEISVLIFLIFSINFFLKKSKILLNNTGQLHQSYTQEYQVPLSGGIFILIYFYYNHLIFDFNLIIYLSLFFILGLIADLNLIKSPGIRFIGQILLVIFFLVNLEINVLDVRIDWINSLLENYYFNIFFVLMCFLVLINGTNFIDGNNGISLGYFSIIFFIIYNLIDNNAIYYNETFIFSFLLLLIILLIINLFNQLYMGDNGVYLVSILTGYILIDIINQNQNLSPYLIVNIFWYPAFEILFSIIRKIKSKYSPLNPDTMHLHQLLFFYFLAKLNLSKNYLNSLTGLSINLFNGIILYFASINYYNTKTQIMFLFLSLIVYLFFYYILLKFKKLSK